MKTNYSPNQTKSNRTVRSLQPGGRIRVRTAKNRTKVSRQTPLRGKGSNRVEAGTANSREHRYALQRDHGFWRLTFGGEQTTLKHEQGLAYVAWLLLNVPAQPIHALDLAAQVAGLRERADALSMVYDSQTGTYAVVERHARVQERGMALDEAEAMRAALRRQGQLERYLENDLTTEPEKLEAERELLALYDYEKRQGARVRDAAQKASDSVGRAIKRLCSQLETATDATGEPNQVLADFAHHIRWCILLPSGRSGGHGGIRPAKGGGGYFIYHRPTGITWETKNNAD